jgi:anaerobic magnesium-protoporphyrin IX monomethyl ester cyclase
MKVLLTTLNAKYIHMNLAIRILYELNHEQHPELEFKEFTIKEKALDIAEYCSNYEVVAFSCYIWNITQTLQVCEKLKQINPHIIIVLGGPEVSYEIEDILRRNPIDYIITGEGEIPFKQFLNHFPNVSHIPNLAYIKDGILIHKQEQVTFDLTIKFVT